MAVFAVQELILLTHWKKNTVWCSSLSSLQVQKVPEVSAEIYKMISYLEVWFAIYI